MDDALLIGLVTFSTGILLIILAIKFYKKSDIGKSLMLMYIMQKHGPNSIVTIDLLQDIIRKCWPRMELRCPTSAWFTRWETVTTAYCLPTEKHMR